MTRTVYQVWRFNPVKDQWFHYNHIPDCNRLEVCRDLFEQHVEGTYKGRQFKPWMRGSEFKIVRCEMTFTDMEIV